MDVLLDPREGARHLLLGNEAIARGALEAGVRLACGYPGTPASEVIESLLRAAAERKIYVEWSTNEKLAMEVAAAGSFAGLRSLCTMKQNGVHVGSDFLLHLALSGTRGGMVVVPCEDPGAVSSINEAEARMFSKMLEIPLLEPGDFQELKDMVRWAFDLSEEIRSVVMVRSVTRLSHGSGVVELGPLPDLREAPPPEFRYEGPTGDPDRGVLMTFPLDQTHKRLQEKMERVREIFESSPFNTYRGPANPDLLVVTSSACFLHCREAISLLGAEGLVGLLKLGTTWPLPRRLLGRYLASTERVLVVEEVLPFLEDNIKALAADLASEIGPTAFFGKASGHLPSRGELTPEKVAQVLAELLGIPWEGEPGGYEDKALDVLSMVPNREWTFCPGCPHRASFWAINQALKLDGRKGFVCGDIGCYTLGILPTGFHTVKMVHAMGSGIGVASGFGQLGSFGMDQPVVAVCGDSTFFHTGINGLVNAVHHRARVIFILLDNGGTAMTGFQPHPGLPLDALGREVIELDPVRICRAMGIRVEVGDPFDLKGTQQLLVELMQEDGGVQVLVLRRACALSPQRKSRTEFRMCVDERRCLGHSCGCNRLCTRVFRCPGLIWDEEKGVSRIDEVICAGCGVCADICPAGAILRQEVA